MLPGILLVLDLWFSGNRFGGGDSERLFDRAHAQHSMKAEKRQTGQLTGIYPASRMQAAPSSVVSHWAICRAGESSGSSARYTA